MESEVETNLVELVSNLVELERRLSMLERFPINRILSLPGHLQKTFIALRKIGVATASDIANVTRRARAVESQYLNVMVVMGLVKKERRKRVAFFQLAS